MITGPVKFDFLTGNINRSAMAFWCVMMERKLFDELGLLDEIFSPGMGEDGDFCIKAELTGHELVQVPINDTHNFGAKTGAPAWSTFPIMHKGSGTFGWLDAGGLIERNKQILDERYSSPNSEFITKLIGKTMIKYSIVIPTYNHCDDLLKPCLESIVQYTDLSNVEVIVVANGCTDNTKEYMESLGEPFKLIWSEEALGYTKATNLGIKAALGEYVVLLNNDTVLLPQSRNDWLNLLEAPFSKKEVGLTGPLELYDDYADAPVLIFFCVMIKKELFEKIGLLDEAFTPGGGEDIDFTVRANKAGYISHVLAPTEYNGVTNIGTFPIWHKDNKTFGEIPIYTNWIVKRNGLINCLRYNKNIKLDLGRGGKNLPHYLTVDAKNSKALVVMDYRKLEFEDNSVTEILAFHLTDRINPYHLEEVIKEWCRVLKPGGKLVIEMPDVEKLCKAFTLNEEKRIDILNLMYGHHHYPNLDYSPRMFGWWPGSMCQYVQLAGFQNIVFGDAQLYPSEYYFRVEAIKPQSWIKTPSAVTITDYNSIQPLPESSPETVQSVFNSVESIRLNLGSGGIAHDGYISVDMYDPRAQIHMNISNLVLPENSVDEILGSHIFEHLDPHNVKNILTNWFNVLKPNGKLILEMPDIEALCRKFEHASWGERFGILNAVYGSVNTTDIGGPDNITSPHLYGYNSAILKELLDSVGFKNIIFGDEHFPHPEDNFRVEAVKPVSKELPKVHRAKLQAQEPLTFQEIFTDDNYKVTAEEVTDHIVVDVGANLGMFSLHCLELGAKRCISVEAQPTVFQYGLIPNVAGYNQITPLNHAVLDVDGKVINMTNAHVASRVTNQTEGVDTVSTITLKTLIKDISLEEKLVLKMDCEGSEYEILLSVDKDTLRRFEVIYIEMHENANENPAYKDNDLLRNKLSEFGFKQVYNNPLYWIAWRDGVEIARELKKEVCVEKWVRV